MKLACHGIIANAFTLIELITVAVIVVLLAGVLMPSLMRAKQRAQRITCVSNLKQIGLAAKTWSLVQSNEFPAKVDARRGGSLEAIATGEVFRHFQVMSNELATPWILICPSDNRSRAKDFGPGLANTNVSYFVGLDADDTQPDSFLAGDRNLTNGATLAGQILLVSSNSAAGWTEKIHKCQGNIGLADGSVQSLSNFRLQEALWRSVGTNRLAMP